MAVKLYGFQEHAFRVSGEKRDLLYLAECLRDAGVEGTLADLAYQIEYEFDVDGIRTENEENNLENYVVEITEHIVHRVIVRAADAEDAECTAEELCNGAVIDLHNHIHDYHRNCYAMNHATADDRTQYPAYSL